MKKLIDEPKSKIFFALWAEDINRYLFTGYNAQSISEIYKALQDYISVDQDESIDNDYLSLSEILKMTGLMLDVSKTPFLFLDDAEERTSMFRSGKIVHEGFLN